MNLPCIISVLMTSLESVVSAYILERAEVVESDHTAIGED